MTEWRRYRPRTTVEAREWTGREDIPGVEGVGCVRCYPRACINNVLHTEFGPNYHHGILRNPRLEQAASQVERGDYIVAGVAGSFVVRRLEFHGMYEEADTGDG